MLFSLKEKGQGMVEYALILVLIAVVVIAALQILAPLVGESGYSITRFLARYWPHGLAIFLLFLLADLCTRLIMDKLDRR